MRKVLIAALFAVAILETGVFLFPVHETIVQAQNPKPCTNVTNTATIGQVLSAARAGSTPPCTWVTGGGATIPSVTNLIKGNGAGNGADSGIAATAVTTLTGVQALTNKTLTAPKVDQINDTNGNAAVILTPTASAVDQLTIANSATAAHSVTISATGSDAAIDIALAPLGTGSVTTAAIINSTNSILGKTASGGSASAVAVGIAANRGLFSSAGALMQISAGGVEAMAFDGGATRGDFGSGWVLGWTSTAAPASTAPDIGISRSAAGVLAVGTGAVGSTVGNLFSAGLNFGTTENGANNAITCSAGCGPTLTTGLIVTIKLAHTLQAGANTFAFNGGGALNIKSHNNVANNIAVAYASGSLVQLGYDGTQWQDMSQ